MFACFDADGGASFGFKATPQTFAELTQRPNIVPAPYVARFHWVKVQSPEALPDALSREFLKEAHQIVFEKLPRKVRESLSPGKTPTRRQARQGRGK